MLDILKKFFHIAEKLPEPPYEYNFLLNLDKKEYPKYLKKMFKAMTGDELNLRNPKTLNEKIQWLKLYDSTQLKTQLTDKLLVRDWIKDRIGEEYLKPVLQVCNSFNEIDFANLPNEFMVKCNHGCKWHYKIKYKEKLLKHPDLVAAIKRRFDAWMQTNFFPWAGFELQYRDIKPCILVEPLLIDEDEPYPTEYEIYCFNGKAKLYQKIKYKEIPEACVYDENFNDTKFLFNKKYKKVCELADENIKLVADLSNKLATDFKFVRIDWLLYRNKVYFNEMTFTPFSGFFDFQDKSMNEELGKMLVLK